jgi:hypothetical protein
MNCQDFNGRLYEYLDGALSAESEAAAREHLRECCGCRRALLQEETAAAAIRHALDQATAGLKLNAAALREPLATLSISQFGRPIAPLLGERAGVRGNAAWLRALQCLVASPFRTIGAVVAVLGLLFLVLGLPVHHRAAQPSAPQAAAEAIPGTCVINVPIQVTTHSFERQGNTVVDAVAMSMAVVHAQFPYPTARPGR